MGQTCCGANGDEKELNSQKLRAVKGESAHHDPEYTQNHAVVTIQRFMRGQITRKIMREQYGFVAKTHLMPHATYTSNDAQVMEARRLVMQIRN